MITNDAALVAARQGRGLCRKVNAKDTLSTATVLTDTGFLYAIPAGKRAVINGFYFHLETTSDWATMEIGVTENANGSGTFTPLTPKFRIDTGTSASGQDPVITPLATPLCITQDDGLALTARVQANDDSAVVTIALNGWYEDEVGP